jgi:hypothetical protein
MRKILAIIAALITGGLAVVTQLGPQAAEAGLKLNN